MSRYYSANSVIIIQSFARPLCLLGSFRLLSQTLSPIKLHLSSKNLPLAAFSSSSPKQARHRSRRPVRLSYVPLLFCQFRHNNSKLCPPPSFARLYPFAKLLTTFPKLPIFFYFASLLYKTLIMKTIYARLANNQMIKKSNRHSLSRFFDSFGNFHIRF